MLRGLLRLLVRLFVFALIAGAVGFVITRLLGGEDDDFEDFDDLESSFEFNETPVEIDVSAAATGADAVDTSAKARVTTGSGKASTEATKGAKSGPRLIDIKGIGPQYETRLQSIGINTMQDLINADANHVAEQLGVIGGTTEVEDWVVQAHTLLSDN
jgi:predicted flap endonuclease-1-like 5' DNA nuclease